MSGISGMGAPGFPGFPKKVNNNESNPAKDQSKSVPQELPVAEDSDAVMTAASVEVSRILEEDRKKIDIKKESDIEELQELSDVDEVELPTPEDVEMINDMKKTIKKESFRVARKVNKSAFKYISQKKDGLLKI